MDPVSLIIGLTMNLYTLNNMDFFHQRSANNKTMNCRWVYVGRKKPDPQNPSLTLFGDVYFKQQCVKKETD